MKFSDAKRIADGLLQQMRPHCLRAEIGGSLRREKPEVGDIEIVCIPIWKTEPSFERMFLDESVNELYRWAIKQTDVRWIKPGTSEIVNWSPKPGGLYWRGLHQDEIKVDVWICSLKNWGSTFLIRTGSAEFNQAIMAYANQTGCAFDGGRFWMGDNELDTSDEETVFKALGLHYVPPQERVNRRQIRRLRR